MKFSQLIEYNMRRKTFNAVKKLVSNLFWEIKIEHLSKSTKSIAFTVCFY